MYHVCYRLKGKPGIIDAERGGPFFHMITALRFRNALWKDDPKIDSAWVEYRQEGFPAVVMGVTLTRDKT